MLSSKCREVMSGVLGTDNEYFFLIGALNGMQMSAGGDDRRMVRFNVEGGG